MIDTRKAALILGCHVTTVTTCAHRMGLGRRDTTKPQKPWLFTADEVEQMLDAIVPRQRPPHCPRCEILTDDGWLCAECQWELEHDGRYQYMDELTGEVV